MSKKRRNMGYYKHTDAAGNIYYIHEDSNGVNRWIKLTYGNPEIGVGELPHDQMVSSELFNTVWGEVLQWLIAGTHPNHGPRR